jgi:hypothetical protein
LFLAACGASAENAGNTSSMPNAAGAKPQIGATVVFKSGAANYGEGKVEKIDGAKYEIRSGDRIAKVDAADVYALPAAGAKPDVKAGDFVVAYSRDVYWAGGEVKNVSGDFVEVEPATGSTKLNVAPDKVIKVSAAATADIRQEVEMKSFNETGKTKKPVLPKDWKPKKGEKIAAQWGFGTWHSAVVKNVNANNIDIDWQNGWSDGTVPNDKIAPYPSDSGALPKTGDYVIVKPQSEIEEWKFAVVTSAGGSECEVKFGDGKTRKLKAGDFIALS